MEVLIWIFLLIAGMWVFQLYLTVKQSQRFQDSVKAIRTEGTTTAIGLGGFRYRGGRAFVALAQKDGVVTGVRVLTGFSVLSNPKPFSVLEGRLVRDLLKLESMPGIKKKIALAAVNAAETLSQK